MSVSNIIEVTFGNSTLVFTEPYYKYNSGMYLQFTDLDLPESYQVHFSNSPSGTSIESVGTSDGVLIPDDVWQSGATIYAWIYLHPTDDSGVTKYEVRTPVSGRADMPDDIEPTESEQTTIDTLINALNSAVSDAQASAQESATNVTHYPKIENGTWHVWDAENSAWVDTEITAEGTDGTDGVGIASTVLNADYTLTITLTDGTVYTTPSIRGEAGQDGTDGTDYVLTETDKTEIANLVSDMSVVEVSGTDPVIVAEANTRYICGEIYTLDFTPSDSGICDIIFTSGSTATVVTLPDDVVMPSGYSIGTDAVYELNFMGGYGVYQSWSTT